MFFKNNRVFLTLLNLSSVIFILISSSNASAAPASFAAEQELQTFYHHPDFSNFIRITSVIVNNYPKRSDLLLTFSTMVVDAHPDYLKKISEGFSKYSSKEKQLLFSTLIATANSDVLSKVDQNNVIKTPPKYTSKTIKELKINDDPDNLDRAWAAYFATGNNEYLQKIIQYINADDFILIASYELVNRKYLCQFINHLNNSSCQNQSNEDIVNSIKKRYPKDAEKMLNKTAVVASSLWSLESNRRQDKFIDNEIQNIMNGNKNLDYWKKINNALKN